MAHHHESFRASASNQPAAPWALLWLGAMASSAWIPLLLADRLATTPRIGSPPELPVAATTSSPIPAPRTTIPRVPDPWIAPKPRDGSTGQLRDLALSQTGMGGQTAVRRGDSGSRTAVSAEQDAKPSVPTPISGSILLGGPLGLDSLQEKPMVPAARLEETLRARSADRLAVVPQHWRPTMRALLNGSERVLPAKVVRLPAAHLRTPEEYPMVLKSDGMVETNKTPPPISRATLERWAQRQKGDDGGGDRPVMVVLEPMTPDPQPIGEVPEEIKKAAP